MNLGPIHMPNFRNAVHDARVEEAETSVLVCYHFFPHYRRGIIELMQESYPVTFSFMGAERDPKNSGIEAYHFAPPANLTVAPCMVFMRDFVIQPRAIVKAITTQHDCVIFLGDVHFLSTWVAAAICRLRKKRVLFWSHGWTKEDSPPVAHIRSVFYRIADGLLLYGNRARAIGHEKGFSPANLYVINNSLNYSIQKLVRESISADALSAHRLRLFGDPDAPIVLFVGRLIEAANMHILIAAMAELKSRGKLPALLVVGDGPDRARIEEESLAAGIRAVFTGSCYDEEVLARHFMSAYVTVSPGKVGLLAMHSLGYGTPVITHDRADLQMPEYECISDGETGAFFEFGNVESLAQAIDRWTESAPGRAMRQACIESIESKYVPEYQLAEIIRAVRAEPPRDSA